jgi:hypothetical protein
MSKNPGFKRKNLNAERTQTLLVKVDESTWLALSSIALKQKRYKTHIIRELVEKFIKEFTKE